MAPPSTSLIPSGAIRIFLRCVVHLVLIYSPFLPLKVEGAILERVVADLSPDRGSFQQLTVFQDQLYFSGGQNNYLYHWDGVHEPVVVTNQVRNVQTISVFQNNLYFTGTTAAQGGELWKYSGSSAPSIVSDLFPGVGQGAQRVLGVFNNKLWFGGQSPNSLGVEPYVIDGVNAPFLVGDLFPGASNSSPEYLVSYQNKAYFTAQTNSSGRSLVIQDPILGRSINTTIFPTSVGFIGPRPQIVYKNELYFTADGNNGYGAEIWKYNGSGQAVFVADIDGTSQTSDPRNFVEYDGALYFQAYYANGDRMFWKYDGTGAPVVADPKFAALRGQIGVYIYSAEFNGDLYMSLNNVDGDDAGEIWRFSTRGDAIAIGEHVVGQASGGGSQVGGLDVEFEEVTIAGNFESTFHLFDTEDLLDLLRQSYNPILNFELPSTTQHMWELSFDGDFEGEVQVTFGYDDSVFAPGFNENNLFIWHYNGLWEKLPVIGRDINANTITVLTGSFSPFVLGQELPHSEPTNDPLPEPASYWLIVCAIATTGLFRRNSREVAS